MTDLFRQAGLYLPDRARMVPLPQDGRAAACHSICPVGHLKFAVGAVAANTAVAIMKAHNKNSGCGLRPHPTNSLKSHGHVSGFHTRS